MAIKFISTIIRALSRNAGRAARAARRASVARRAAKTAAAARKAKRAAEVSRAKIAAREAKRVARVAKDKALGAKISRFGRRTRTALAIVGGVTVFGAVVGSAPVKAVGGVIAIRALRRRNRD